MDKEESQKTKSDNLEENRDNEDLKESSEKKNLEQEDKTKELEKGAPIPVVITAYKDRSFDFVTKLPPVSYYLKKAAKIKKGNSTPGRSLVGKVTVSDIEKIAKEKMQDLNAIDLKGAVNMVKGSAVSMGMEVIS